MNKFIIATICLLSASPAFAAKKLSAGCKAGIEQDLLRSGYTAKTISLISQKRGSCDSETCNPDVLKLYVEAEGAVELIVEASGPTRGYDWCRVSSVKVAR